jgi:hypothetical protein
MLTRNLTERADENHVKAGIPAEIRTKHLQGKDLEHDRYADLLDK